MDGKVRRVLRGGRRWLCALLTIVVIIGCDGVSPRTSVSIAEGRWLINGVPVLQGTPAEGLLVNVRMVNAVFEDEGPAAAEHLPADFDPEVNTRRFIEQMPAYYAHGVRAFTISLQGGVPGYEGAVNSAFLPDGGLRSTYLERVKKVIHEADRQGMVVILSCLYQRQHSHDYALNGKQAIFNAIGNVAQWITDEGFTNVVLEVANEFAHGGYKKWPDGDWLITVDAQVELIRHARTVAPNLLVSTSGMGSGVVSEAIARESDFILLHFNRTPLSLFRERITQALSHGKPVVCNEDDKLGKLGAEAARISIQSGAGWGFMHLEKNQFVPFEFEGARDDTLVYRMLARLTTPGARIDDIDATPFSVLITDPIDGDVFRSGETISIRSEVAGIEDTTGLQMQFFSNDKLIGKRTSAPWVFAWENAPKGKHDLMVILRGAKGEEVLRSGIVDIEVVP